MSFVKEAKSIQCKKESIFNKWSNWVSACRRMQIDLHLSPCTKFKSKGIKELNITTEEKWVEIIQHLKNIDDYEEAAFSRPSKEAHI